MQMPGKSFCVEKAVVLWRTAVVRFVHWTGHLLGVMPCSLLFWRQMTLLNVGKVDEPHPNTVNFILVSMRTSNPDAECCTRWFRIACIYLFVLFFMLLFLTSKCTNYVPTFIYYNSNIFGTQVSSWGSCSYAQVTSQLNVIDYYV
jgi:hypothetical protein